MAGRPGNRASQAQAIPPAPARQNEYFVPRDGIDREVITSDICRYLGNDALVRPGTYESQDGRVTQGYYITAYRNLTSAMIQDLKADSARWEQERRAAARATGGVGGRDLPRGQSDYSAWKTAQRERQEKEYASAMDIDYPAQSAAPGNPVYGGQPQYPGVPTTVYAQPDAYSAPVHSTPIQYAQMPQYAYANPPPTQYSPQPQTAGDRYTPMHPPPPAAAATPISGSYAQDNTAFVHGSNYQTTAGYATAGPVRMTAMPHATAPPSRTTYTAPTTGTPVYGTETDPYARAPPVGNPAAQAFPTDGLYGRGAAQMQGYAAAPEPQYGDVQNQGLPPVSSPANPTPAAAQMASGGAQGPRRDRDSEPKERERERERDHRDHRARRPEPERGDRHRHRHR